MQDKIDGVHGPKPFKITVDDLRAVKQLEALQAFRIKDKSFSVKMELELDRTVGPGGGIGHPLGTNSGSSGARIAPPSLHDDTNPRTTTSRGGATINIDTVQAHDYNDFLRQLSRQQLAQGGGGVNLAGAR
jgi:hypothetical protein